MSETKGVHEAKDMNEMNDMKERMAEKKWKERNGTEGS